MDILILFVILIALFHRSYFCTYVVDDTVGYKLMKRMKERGLTWGNFSYNLKHALYGAGIFRNAKQEYLFTTLLHFTICVLIYDITDSLMVSVLYMVNPVNNQTAVWLNGRRYAIGVLCCLLVWKFKILFLPLYAFAVWLHVHAIALPILILTTKYWYLVPMGFLTFYVFGWKGLKSRHDIRKKDFAGINELQKIRPQKLIIYVKTLGFYFFHTIFPNKPRMYHEFLYYFSRYPDDIKRGYSFNFEFFKGLAVCTFAGYEIVIQHNFWMLWWLAFISQWGNIYGVTQNAADRYCSLAGIGLMVTLNKYILILPTPSIAYTFFITFYILRYLPLFRAYTSIDNFHYYHINIEPGAVESRTLQATRCLAKNDPFSAYALIKQGILYRPQDFKLLLLMSQVLFAMKKFEPAQQILNVAEKHVPLGDEEDCKREFEKIRTNPSMQPPKPNRKDRRAIEAQKRNQK